MKRRLSTVGSTLERLQDYDPTEGRRTLHVTNSLSLKMEVALSPRLENSGHQQIDYLYPSLGHPSEEFHGIDFVPIEKA